MGKIEVRQPSQIAFSQEKDSVDFGKGMLRKIKKIKQK